MRYKILFNKLKHLQEGCYIPFITIGDPCIKLFYKIIDILVNSGADALELGIPFSDPLADGVVVQNANIRSLSHGINVVKCFEILNNLRIKYPNIPIGILTYANIIFNQGIKKFYKTCQKIQIDSVLIPDVPVEESIIFNSYAQLYNISTIFICPPNAELKLIKFISKNSTAYIYLTSRSGVTGIKKNHIHPNINIIKTIKKYSTIPIIHGFGISNVSQIKQSLSLGIDGIICGSIIIKIIEKLLHDEDNMLKEIKKLTLKLKTATINKIRFNQPT